MGRAGNKVQNDFPIHDMSHQDRREGGAEKNLLGARQCIWETSEPVANSSASHHKELPLLTTLPSSTHTDSLRPFMEAPAHYQYKTKAA